MGVYYWLANHTRKEYIDFDGAKLAEQKNEFDRLLLQTYLMNVCRGESQLIEFVGDETGGWDKCQTYEEKTCDTLLDMFETTDFIPSRWQFGFVYDKFKGANRLKDLTEWMKKWDNKDKGGAK